MRNRLFGLTMVLALVGQNAHSAETGQAVAGLKKETPYAEARLKLLSAGWSPAPQDAAQSAEERCGARTEICEAYPETDACSGTGMGFCVFRFRDEQGSILAITTVGEELADLTIYDWRAQ